MPPSFINTALDLLLPRRCVVCDEHLNSQEKCMCAACAMNIPRLHFASYHDNELTRRLWNAAPVHTGTALMTYRAGTNTHSILEAMKYKGRPDLCQLMGRMLATEISKDGFFSDIDLIIPIPLSRKRQRHRGYNQAEHIALGINQITQIPIDTTHLWRQKDNQTQTALSGAQRIQNVQGIFAVKDPHTLTGRHILLVDDIITTGATTSSAVKCLIEAVPDLTISIACIGVTSLA